MPWQSNDGGSGGPWGSGGAGGGSGGGSGGGPRNPWGRGGGNRGPQGGGGPNFDDFIRRGQERLKTSLPGGGGGGAGQPDSRIIRYAIVGFVLLWIIFSSVFRVNADEMGVVKRFGEFQRTAPPGLHFKLPTPLETVEKPTVTKVNQIDVGNPGSGESENLVLTGDQNIVDIAYAIRWKIGDPVQFLFTLQNPEGTIREVGESAMRAAVSQTVLTDILGPQRSQVADQVRDRTQELLNEYRAGIDIVGVDIRQADPPAAVDEAFKDVSSAQQDAESYVNQARAYAQQVVAQAQGETSRFDAVYQQYRLAPEVTRKRIYLDTMEDVLKGVDKTVLEAEGVVPYLPIPSPAQNRAAQTPAAGGQ